ncbi:MAG TPA: ComEC/Rec2 family competence protein, partial [Planctomycetota bacterium]|nr:ComEC/Rec2 family competence protein [Planctomycetota bacterium]
SQGWARYAKHALLVGLAATFATAPITIIWFGRLTLASIPGSVIVAPLMGPMLCVGVLKAVLGAHPLPVFLAEALHSTLIFLCGAIERLPGGSLELSQPSLFGLILWAISAAVAARFAVRGQGARLVGSMVLGMGALLPSAAVCSNQAHLLDGGRGAAIFLALDQENLLVDTGPRSSRIVEQLRRRGIASIDALLLTHEHEDHAGGRPDVAKSFQEPPVLAAFEGDHERVFRGSRRIPQTEIPWPPRGYEPPNANDRSLATPTQLKETRLLITGDLEGPGMRHFLRRADQIDCDLLVLPHHGARQPYLLPLLCRVQPCMSWLPARAGFPSEDVMLVRWLGIKMAASWCSGPTTWPETSCARECRAGSHVPTK